MVHRRAKLILIASAAWFLLSARPPGCLALPVDMGIAGPSYWTVVQTGGGTITVTPPVSKSGKRKKSNRTVATSAPPIGIMGNVAVAQGGQISDSGDQFEGDLYLGDDASAQFSGTYANNSPVSGIVHMSNGSTISPSTGYSFNNTSSGLQPMLDQVRLDAMNASTASLALSPTSTLNQISLNRRKTLTLSAGVYDLTSLKLTHATLTLSGSGSFVFNISSTFALKSAQILLANGATESNVLFNYTGTSDVTLSAGRRGTSVLHGIILAMNANVNLAQGLVVGEIISGRNITVGAGSLIQAALLNVAPPFNVEAPRVQSVPEQTSTIVLSFIALCLLVGCRSLSVCRFSASGTPKRIVSR